MMICESGDKPYLSRFSDGKTTAYCDIEPARGGGGDGFWPHDLLEASLGCCIDITLRMYAERHSIPLAGTVVRVKLHKDDPAEAVFEYEIELKGDLSPEHRTKLLRVAAACPVHKTLTKKMSFRQVEPQA